MASLLDYLNPEQVRGLLGQLAGGGSFSDPMSGYQMQAPPAPQPQFAPNPFAGGMPQMAPQGGVSQDPFNFVTSGMMPTNQPPPAQSVTQRMPVSLAPPPPEERPQSLPLSAPQQGGMPQGGGGLGDRISMALSALVNPQTPFTYDALRQTGVPHAQALLQANSLETAQANMPTWGIIGQDDFGNNKYGWINRATGTIAIPGAGPGGQGIPNLLEATDRDGNPLMGQAYMAHLEKNTPSMAAAVNGALNGDISLSGRKLQLAVAAASRVDPNFNMNVFNARKELMVSANKATPNSFGGQRNAGNTAVQHLGTAAEQAVKLGNWDAGQPDISHAINWIRQHGSTEQAAAANALNTTIDRYVAEVGRFYSGSASGGVMEREQARQRFNAAKTPQELAAAVQSERDLFSGKLNQLQDQRDSAFAGDARRAEKLVGPIIMSHGQEGFRKIDSSLSSLLGGKPSQGGWTVRPL